MHAIFFAAAPLAFLVAAPVSASNRGHSAQEDPAVGPTQFSARQIHAYAAALLDIQKMRQSLSAQAAKLAPEQAAILKNKAQSEMIAIVERHGLDLPGFNAITTEVERQRRLRHEVRQLMMEQLLST
ncbi:MULTISPECIES: DUF4168 domain-containing protein [unclassified Sphingobium]|uniref:DUF4168 domain-containing protein n=1 Tax=unclassified Sphingobium TaxID=2611147 RepID=UPI0005CC7765|nr:MULTISPECIES: DUF4168 domain-containing protein [unclassified Sphingobium]AJR26994.1 hypothetical protein TZ53_24820 [Sphingobium sp. YBL2]QPI75598.1 DUF4168 domain-containing protein [Sphingobium sp. Cam5-1]